MVDEKFLEVLDFAISEEDSAEKLYAKLADRVDSSSAKKLLTDMSKMEHGHKLKLEAIKNGEEISLKSESAVDLKISDYLIDKKIDENSSVQDVLIFSIKSEESAKRMYEDLAALCVEKDRKDVLLALSFEESMHKKELEVYYDNFFNLEN